MSSRARLRKNDVRQDLGFTLLEVLIAVAILGFVVLAFSSAEIMAVSNSRTGRHVSSSAAAAEEILELMRRNKANVLSYNGFDTSNPATRPATPGTAQNDYDQWSATVARVPGACGSLTVTPGIPIPSTNSATATIVWPPCGGAASRRIVVSTVF